MGSIVKPKTWADGDNVLYSDINTNFDTLYNEVNGNLDNNNIKASAAIAESKITFSTSTGHNHDGSNSKLIPAFAVFTVTGAVTVNTDPSPWIPIRQARTISEVYAVVKTAPTGASLIVDVEVSEDDGVTWTSIWNTTTANRITIAASSKSDNQTSFDTTSISSGSLLRIAVDQVGSTVAGADLTVTVKL